ncbi:hypothetical protein GSI_05719 [Ganoderma sinense ZZ0214-1]|uniref:Uncharacterized protein n=1 Tax=Ganoderma sinense ZZ0214-1 TaxID=1077348 RepID=A0A2G8SB81_9APHY|nr:hypothetical protein GSI_05719 [Ganoderma sinense ZZ0214-1]
MSNWSIEFSSCSVTGHAWGKTIQDEFAAYDACLFVLVHSSGSVYLTIVEKGCDDLLVLDFGAFSQDATLKRWGSSRITYRGEHGGLFLAFPDGADLEGFEDCCDRILRVFRVPGVAPKVKDLQDLGVIPLPRLVGGFLTGLVDNDVPDPLLLGSDDSSVSSLDTNSTVDTVDAFTEEELAVISGELQGVL